MNILSKLKNRKLGLIELMSMGFEVYIKNLKPILLIFSTIYLPFLIILSGRQFLLSNNPLESIFVFSLFIWKNIYFIPIAIITNNYVYGRHYNYQSVFKKILASLVPLLLMSLEFIIVVFLIELRAFITVLLKIIIISIISYFVFFLLLDFLSHNYFFTVSIVLVYLVLILRLIVLKNPVIPVIIYIINNQYYGLAFILRDQWGEDAFAYSRSIVKDNWWRVFFFSFLVMVIDFGLQLFNIIHFILQFFNNIPFINDFWFSLLSQTLAQFIAIGIVIGSTLLFLNLDFHKKLDN
ncbi:MAG: hypothetical protein F6K50_41565 [Moorea sp. SIO3I7]|uniref:hypothetical protein n=1 Tax=Moorena sp. SIO3I8 TaxID=2607833 RepID=UPI0013BFC143|nr:hypothetical protein [Moorena sp. SIO3I8]NEO01647.1 hypothetical protein [Moorena sp. SIO3I7]NEO06939.1 hypothetical protein [Moorena sp. SIO3I8]